jgi:hypothetical protein
MTAVERIVVKFTPASDGVAQTLSELCDVVARILNGSLVRPPSHTGRAVFKVPASSEIDRLLEDVRKLPTVEYAERDAIDRAQA